MSWPQVYIILSPLEPSSYLPPSLPTPPGCHRALALGSLCYTSNSHWPSILHMVIYVSMLFSQVIPHFFPTASKSLFSVSGSPLLPCK